MKTLVKSKIVINEDGKGLTIYFWKKTFWIFGRWYPFGCSTMSVERTIKESDKINDNTVSRVLFNNFVSGQSDSGNKLRLMDLKKKIHQTSGHTFTSFANFHMGNKNRASQYADLARETHLECAKLINELIEEAK